MIRALCLTVLSLLAAAPAFAGGSQPYLRGAQLRKAAHASVKQEFGWAAPDRRVHYKVLPRAAEYRGPIRNVLVSKAKIGARDVRMYNMSNRYSDFRPLERKPGQKAPRTKVFGGAQINLRTGKVSGGGVG